MSVSTVKEIRFIQFLIREISHVSGSLLAWLSMASRIAGAALARRDVPRPGELDHEGAGGAPPQGELAAAARARPEQRLPDRAGRRVGAR